MGLIDAAEAVKIIKRYDDRGIALDEVTRITDGIAREIEAMPTVDAEPVRHGKWERVEYSFVGGYRCSCCGSKALDDSFNYCGYCGAKMDGE